MASIGKTVVFDFDGVIHSYSSGWRGADCIPDPPVPGIREVIEKLQALGYRVVISSSRAATPRGEFAIRVWLDKYHIPIKDVFSTKPPAAVYIDDRAICFDGDAATLCAKVLSFQPWYGPNMRPAKPAERHAHWVYEPNANDWGLGGWCCSKCHYKNDAIGGSPHPSFPISMIAGTRYCASCGALMDEEVD